MGHRSIFLKSNEFLYVKIVFILATSADLDKMPLAPSRKFLEADPGVLKRGVHLGTHLYQVVG